MDAAHPTKIQSGAPAAPRPRLWWCNADFDLTLAHGGGKMPARVLAAAGAMTWPLWPALAPEDTLIVPEPPPGGYRAYLEAMGLRVPRFVTEAEAARAMASPAARRGREGNVTEREGDGGDDGLWRARFTPFGWSSLAAVRNAAMACPTPHPSLEVVRRVNSRAFSLEVERTLGGEPARATFCATEKSVMAWLETAPAGRYVAKGNHGLAGIGQVRFEIPARPIAGNGAAAEVAEAAEVTEAAVANETVRLRALSAALRRLAARQGGLVVEEELAVVREWGVLFRLGRDGRRSAVRRHRLLTGPEGGYAGAMTFDNGARADALWDEHGANALNAVDGVARALHAAGYFGPVSLDMFVFEREGVRRLRPLVDLNARQSMAWPLHGLAARFPARTVLFRQFPAAAVRQFDDYHTLSRLCDNLSFDHESQRGAILLTPLLPFSRVSWAIIGRDEPDALALHEDLLGRLALRTRNTKDHVRI